MPVNAVSLPFREQAEFLRRKINLPTQSWTEIYEKEHDYAFVVAGANRDDLLTDFREAVEAAINEGQSLEEFRDSFDAIVKEHGWSYNGGRNWRSRVIYDTNLQQSYNAGRYQQLMAMRETRPYWQYIHSDTVAHPRPEHEEWNNLILRWDDPWWDTHFPMNGWGCQCRVNSLNERNLKAKGRAGPDTAPAMEWEDQVIGKRNPSGPTHVRVPRGVDPGFAYTPGKSRLSSAVPPESPTPPVRGSGGGPGLPNSRPLKPLPAPQKLPASALLPKDLTPTQYAQEFLKEFGATLEQPAIFKDVIGESVVVGADMFTTTRNGEIKADKNGRGEYMKLLAAALQSPDEIWARIEWHFAQRKAVVRRRYVTQILLPQTEVPALAVFEYGKDGWAGVTVFSPNELDINDLRVGVRLYERQE